METLLHKLIYTGVGVVAQAKDRLEKTINELVEEEKLSTKEGKKIVDEFLKSTDGKKSDVEREFNSFVERLVKSFSFTTRNEVKELEDRIALLEAMVARMDTDEAHATEGDDDKKSAPKRRTARGKKEDGEAEDQAE